MTHGSVTSNNVITWVTGTTILDTACSLTPAQSASTSTATGLTATTLTVPTCRYPLTATLSLNVYRSLPLTCPVNSLSLLPSWSFPYSNIPIYSINPMTPSTFNMYYGDQMILKFTGLTPGNYDFLTFSLGTPLGTSTNFVVNLIKGPPTKVINSGDCPNYSVCSTVSSSLLCDPYATFGAPTADWMNLFVWDRCFHCGSYYSTWFVQIQRIATQTPILDINPFTTAITPILSVVTPTNLSTVSTSTSYTIGGLNSTGLYTFIASNFVLDYGQSLEFNVTYGAITLTIYATSDTAGESSCTGASQVYTTPYRKWCFPNKPCRFYYGQLANWLSSWYVFCILCWICEYSFLVSRSI
jgi:hypothetical protein